MQAHSVYLHIPFCKQRCYYCDFNTFAGQEKLIQPYVEALIKEIGQVSQSADERIPVHTVFFGGGTPSLLSARQFGQILTALSKGFDLQADMEMSLEANPGTVNYEKLAELRRLGLNRISLGVQSLNPAELALLGRIHTVDDVTRAVEWARQAGFEQINLDLILGLPDQSLQSWQFSVEKALVLNPEHISIYALTIESGTPFNQWVQRGILSLPDDDVAADQYEWAQQYLLETGYQQYEISNWAKIGAKPGQNECRHNLQYWHNSPYFGFGAGAHGYLQDLRIANVNEPNNFIQLCNSAKMSRFPVGPAAVDVTTIDLWTEMQETMMVGLRLTEAGVSLDNFSARFGLPIEAAFGNEIKRLKHSGLLEYDEGRIRLTRRGILMGNQVFMQFVGKTVEDAPEIIRQRL
jgi:oxygen-independent coproporphyrinogen-3 oxidase